MDFLSDYNISKYNFDVKYDDYYVITKTINKVNDDVIINTIYQYPKDKIINIINYCKTNDFKKKSVNRSFKFFKNICKEIDYANDEIKFYREFNKALSNNEFIKYVKLVNYTFFPSLMSYPREYSRKSVIYTKTFENNFKILNNEYKMSYIELEIYDNKVLLTIYYYPSINNLDELIKHFNNLIKLMDIKENNLDIYLNSH